VDLNDGAWVKVLNVLDSCLEAVLRAHPSLVALWDAEGPPKPRPVAAEAQRIADAISQVTAPTQKNCPWIVPLIHLHWNEIKLASQ
jgi:hypothetical protein